MPDRETWREQYPFESHYLQCGGQRYHYLDEGPLANSPDDVGPAGETVRGPLLMVHGNPTWSFYWRRLVERWRSEHRVVVPDHIGCGLSDKPQRYDYCLAQHVDNLCRLIEELDLRQITLFAHDWGGAIGMGAATAMPDRFARFVLMNTAAFRGQPIPLRIRLCRGPLLGKFLVRGLNGFCRAALRMATTRRDRFTREVSAGYLAPYDNWAHRVAVHRFVVDIPSEANHPSRQTLEAIESRLSLFRNHPVLLPWGMRDWCFTPWYLDRFAEFFPDAKACRFDDAGHYVVEDAHERIIPEVEQFFAAHPLPCTVGTQQDTTSTGTPG